MNRAPILAMVLAAWVPFVLHERVRERIRYQHHASSRIEPLSAFTIDGELIQPTGWEGYERPKVHDLREQLTWR